MRKNRNVPRTSRKKWIVMSFLAAAAMLYLTACSEPSEPAETRMTTFSEIDYPPEQTSSPDSAGTASTETTGHTEPDAEQTTQTPVRPVPPPDGEPDIHTETNELLESIPYETVYEYSDQYYEGERIVRRAGIEGCRLVTVVTTYKDGEVTDVQRSEEVLFAPDDEVIVIGTRTAVTYDTVIVTEDEIPFETEYEYVQDAYDDEKTLVREGQNGFTTLEYLVTYEKGVEISRELVSSEITEPISQVIRVGTMPAWTEESLTLKENPAKHTTRYEYDFTLEDGVRQVKVAGVDGFTENVYRITYYHGEESSRELVKSTVHKPQEEVIVIGTKKEETFGMPYVDAAHGGYDYNVTQDFGGSNNHGGIDFGVWYGQPIVSVMSGTVVYAYDEGDLPTSDLRWTYGTYVVVEHENGTRSYYAHMKSRTVSVGDTVEKGEVVGYSGNTGRVSPAPTPSNPLAGTHLHFEIRVWNGSTYVKADPKEYLPRWNY